MKKVTQVPHYAGNDHRMLQGSQYLSFHGGLLCRHHGYNNWTVHGHWEHLQD